MPRPGRIRVEIVYALPAEQDLRVLEVDAGTTAGEAIAQSGIVRRFPEIDLARARVGVFGRLVRLDTRLRDGDRVEIYRPLIAEPTDARRKRAKRTSPAKQRA